MPDFEMALSNIYLLPLINEDYQITIKNILDFSATVMVIDLCKNTSDLRKGYYKLSINDKVIMESTVKNFIDGME